MKLVIENNDGVFYAMFETESHHKRVKRTDMIEVSSEILGHDCRLAFVLEENEFMVIDVVKPKAKARGK